MLRRLTLALATFAALEACTPAEDWNSAEYIQYRLEQSDPRAFQEMSHLSPEDRATLVPTLVEIYNSGVFQEESLRALVTAADARGREVFLAALQRSDDNLAGQAARGLAAISDSASSEAIAQRLATVTQTSAYPAFVEAIAAIPTPAAAEVVAGMLMRPVERIGGIATVRKSCGILGAVESPSPAVIDALVFSLSNFEPQPFQDALADCELALLAHGDAAVPKLAETFRGENAAVNTRLLAIQYQAVVGQLRAAAVLAHMTSPAAMAPLLQWVGTHQDVPAAQLSQMTNEQAAQWYEYHGQMFTAVIQGLAYAHSDDTVAALRALESVEGEGSLLANFSLWFQLSAGAEFGLRTSVQEALMKVGNDTDRELLWQRATEGALGSARGAYFVTEFRKNALHYVGRTARPGELARFTALAAAQQNPAEFSMHVGYFALAEICGDDVACYVAKLSDPTAVLEHESVTAALAPLDEATRQTALGGVAQNVRVGAIWQLALRFGGQLAASEALFDNLANDSMQARFETTEALRFVSTLPTDAAARLDAAIEANMNSTNPQARDLRQAIRVTRAIRL
ncbi:MAG: hypothetical protein H6698_07250 [Myxococcales bacterium]|nr:hypothetical protein [Myxococcales bacterium]MCB9531731.1 hypothetical protein [Myxococcales bacterium]MCB9534102.1 hypothetical protein [Myxococcales bacterium]